MMWVVNCSRVPRVCVNSLACVRLKGCESECFRINSGVRQGCIMSSWLFNVYMEAVMRELKMGMGRMGVIFREEGRGCDCMASCIAWITKRVYVGV